MNKAINIVFILLTGTVFSQEIENYSFYFSDKAGSELEKLTNVDERHFNKYTLKAKEGNEVRVAAGDHLVVDKTGIAIEKNRIMQISREEVRENSKYWVKDGYLFGYTENDSVMVAAQEDNYIFLYPVKNYLFEVGKSNMIFKAGSRDQYIILAKEDNGYFSSLLISFSISGVELKELYFEGDCKIENIKKKEVVSGDYKTYILSPSKKEWNLIFGCYLTYDTYSVVVN